MTVGNNETVETVARKYGVPMAALMQTNNIASPSDVRPGQRLVIPEKPGTRTSDGPPSAVAGAIRSANVKPRRWRHIQ